VIGLRVRIMRSPGRTPLDPAFVGKVGEVVLLGLRPGSWMVQLDASQFHPGTCTRVWAFVDEMEIIDGQ